MRSAPAWPLSLSSRAPVLPQQRSAARLRCLAPVVSAVDRRSAIEKAKKEGRRIIAVGTTTVRALESFPTEGHTNTHLFITPGYTFKIVNGLLTNFHQPRSTPLILVSALAGRKFILKAYQEAIQKRYRLFSYGDCMFII